MNLKSYFKDTEGTGVLATADSKGKVDTAIYARPHFMKDGTIAMIMRDRLTHHNLESNSHACYMFIEKGPGYKGKRLFLTKVREVNRESHITLKIGISSCLLGNAVRWNAGHKRDKYLTHTLGQFVTFIPVCPEVEAGFGIPPHSG